VSKTPTIDVLIVGAGPVGLLLGNLLGMSGVNVVIAEGSPALIDYPRGVGMDDESLRAFQTAGLSAAVLPHTTPNHVMRFVDGHGRVFADIDPQTDEFGWPRRNAFIQPLVDRASAEGLGRFPNVDLRLGCRVIDVAQGADDVIVTVETAEGTGTLQCTYLVGCDGGRSATREGLGIAFQGKTDPNRWIVVDILDDPIGHPGAYLHADPARPYASIALPHGIRRLEFMLFPGEGEDGEIPRDVLNGMMAKILPDPRSIRLLRARIYTHNGRLAERFRQGRILLAGDAAHIMPVWQGQGFNSGVRDAINLAWKLALVVKGICEDRLLDSYEAERREHARAMISLSEAAGTIIAMRNPIKVFARDLFIKTLNFFPAVKRYFTEMRFKPMPRYRSGALYYGKAGFNPASPVGRMFIQPRVSTIDAENLRLDDVLGASFALIGWGVDPSLWLSARSKQFLDKLSARSFWAVPMTGLQWEAERSASATVIGDLEGKLKRWFGATPHAMVLLRPDRFVAAHCGPQELDAALSELANIMAHEDSPAT
jgi:3-(3-hydroxy-phenyl)propionate hydroxylase